MLPPFKKSSTVVESACEILHPRPKTFWLLTQHSLRDMEEEVNAPTEEESTQRRRDSSYFERSDDDEIVCYIIYHRDLVLNYYSRLNSLNVETITGLSKPSSEHALSASSTFN